MNTGQTAHTCEEEFHGADARLVERLTRLQGEPSSALLARVRAIPSVEPIRRRLAPRLAWAASAVTMLVASLALASPTIRAALGVVQDTIGDVVLSITDRLGDDSDVIILSRQPVSLAEARALVPFSFSLPATSPSGWTLSDQVQVGHPEGGVDIQFMWTNPGQSSIYLSVFQSAEGSPIPQLVGPGSYQEIQIHGQPAALVHGGWDSVSREWSHPDAVAVLWALDGVQYALWTSGSDLAPADLITMAESTP